MLHLESLQTIAESAACHSGTIAKDRSVILIGQTLATVKCAAIQRFGVAGTMTPPRTTKVCSLLAIFAKPWNGRREHHNRSTTPAMMGLFARVQYSALLGNRITTPTNKGRWMVAVFQQIL